MYDKILVAVDHSGISGRALLAARDLALLSKGEVWVLHLREREIAVRGGMTWSDETAWNSYSYGQGQSSAGVSIGFGTWWFQVRHTAVQAAPCS